MRPLSLNNERLVVAYTVNMNGRETVLPLVGGTPDLDAQVEKVALGIANNAPLTLRAFKEAIRELSKADGARNLTGAHEAIDDCFASADYREGIDAFLAKRRPSFRGQ